MIIIIITESKKFTGRRIVSLQKHKIYLYKEDFSAFAEIFGDMTAYVLKPQRRGK
jgi:hypothetical protein